MAQLLGAFEGEGEVYGEGFQFEEGLGDFFGASVGVHDDEGELVVEFGLLLEVLKHFAVCANVVHGDWP